MTKSRRHNPWLWIPSLYTAEEIPLAMVTFVALLMFVQMGVSLSLSTLYSAVLFLPCILKPFFKSMVRQAAGYHRYLIAVESLLFVSFSLTALYLESYKSTDIGLLACMLVISSLCAWHELLGRMYYERMLYPRQQRLFRRTKTMAALSTNVLTYGLLIMFVGLIEIFFRQSDYHRTQSFSWAMLNYIVAGTMLLFTFANLLLIKRPHLYIPQRSESLTDSVRRELGVVRDTLRKPYVPLMVLTLFMLLLPQSLMFYTRVFFLLGTESEGGLNCSIQEVGFAQGAIGVIAFCLSLLIGRRMMQKIGDSRMFWYMVVSLTLSPVFYMAMSAHPLVGNMDALCCMTALAQLCFGFGINACIPFVRYMSGERYRNVTNNLYLPLVAACMIVPLAVSGVLYEWLGAQTYFLVNFICCPLAIIMAIVSKCGRRLFV